MASSIQQISNIWLKYQTAVALSKQSTKQHGQYMWPKHQTVLLIMSKSEWFQLEVQISTCQAIIKNTAQLTVIRCLDANTR